MKKTNAFLLTLVLLSVFAQRALAIKIGDDSLLLGKPGSSSDKIIQIGTTSQGKIKYDATNNKLRFANDGSTYKDLGTGSGGAGGIELLADNPGFEAGISTNWTASSGGTVTARTGSNALFDSTSARFQATTTGQTYTTTAYAVPVGLANGACLASIYYSTLEATNLYTISVLDGSGNVIAAAQSLSTTSSGQVKNFYLPFQCPAAATTIKIQIASTGTATFMDLDNAHLGSDTRLADVSQAQWLGSVNIQGWSGPSSITAGAFTDYGTLTSATYTVSGGVARPATDLIAVRLQNLPIARYVFVLSFTPTVSASTTNCHYRLSDGSGSLDGEMAIFTNSGAQTLFGQTFQQSYTPTASISDTTFRLQGYRAAGAGNCDVNNNSGATINVYRYPLSTDTAVRADQMGWHVDANISGANPSLGTAAQTSYVDIEDPSLTLTNNTGSNVIQAQIPCSSTNPPTGTTCAAGNESVGVSFNLPTAGDVFACASFAHNIVTGASGVVNTTFEIVETPINAQTVSQEGKSRIQDGFNTASSTITFPDRVCGVLSFASAGQKVLRLMYEQAVTATVTTSQLFADTSSTNGRRDIHWEVYPLNYQSGALPIFKGMVTSNTSGKERIERFQYASCTSSPCTINTQSGSWITSMTRASTGVYTANIAAGSFTSAPVCTHTTTNGAAVTQACHYTATTSTISILCSNTSTNAAVDTAGDMICMGQN